MSFEKISKFKYTLTVIFLIVLTILLSARVLYIYLDSHDRFPINKIKIIASYKHITRSQLESVLSRYQEKSFYTFPANKLYKELMAIPWIKEVDIARIRPDIVRIVLTEKKAMAIWNNEIVTTYGDLIQDKAAVAQWGNLPHLIGSESSLEEILAIYKQLNAELGKYGFKIDTVEQRPNHSFEITLTNGILLKTGKHDTLLRVRRFCKAYPIISESHHQITAVDLRYPRGMAIQQH